MAHIYVSSTDSNDRTRYDVDTDEETAEARRALRDAGLSVADVFVGEDEDEIRTSVIVLAMDAMGEITEGLRLTPPTGFSADALALIEATGTDVRKDALRVAAGLTEKKFIFELIDGAERADDVDAWIGYASTLCAHVEIVAQRVGHAVRT